MEGRTIANTIQSMVIQIMKATIISEIKVSASSRILATKMSMEWDRSLMIESWEAHAIEVVEQPRVIGECIQRAARTGTVVIVKVIVATTNIRITAEKVARKALAPGNHLTIPSDKAVEAGDIVMKSITIGKAITSRDQDTRINLIGRRISFQLPRALLMILKEMLKRKTSWLTKRIEKLWNWDLKTITLKV